MIQERNLIPALRAKIRAGALQVSPNSKIIYVDSGNANAGTGNLGNDPNAPMSTLASALTAATTGISASNGDIVVLLPGHAETISASITQSLAGISIIGLGEGNSRPALTIAGAIDGINFTGANCLIENVRFPAGDNAATVAINAGAAKLTIRNCRFESSTQEDTITVPDAGDGLVVEDCEFYVTGNGVDGLILFESASTDQVRIRRNYFSMSDATNAPDAGAIEVAAAATNVIIEGNTFDSAGVAGTAVSGVATLGVGSIVRNNVYDNLAANPEPEYFVPGLGYKVTKSHNLATDNVDLFTVTGRVMIKLLLGEVTTVVGGAATYLIRVKTTNTNLFAATTIDTAAVDTLIVPHGDSSAAASVAVKNETASDDGDFNRIVGSLGDTATLESDMDAADTGIIRWDLYYIPLDAGAKVVAA